MLYQLLVTNDMKKIILLMILSTIFVMTSCNHVTEKDILGIYAENHKFYKDTIWILPDGNFRQKAYNRDGSLFYDAQSHWSLEDGMITIDSLYTLPEGCDNVDTIYHSEDTGGGYLKISRKDGNMAVFVPYWIELDKGIYFYKF